MNINSSTTYSSLNKTNTASTRSAFDNVGKKVNKEDNRHAQEPLFTNQISSRKKIDPILLDKVFTLKSTQEQDVVNYHRPSDLYKLTETIQSNGNSAATTVGLDLYV